MICQPSLAGLRPAERDNKKPACFKNTQAYKDIILRRLS